MILGLESWNPGFLESESEFGVLNFLLELESHKKNKDSASLLSTAVQPGRSVHAACKHSHIRQSVQSQAFLNKNYLLT